jgi:asparagine synthase (glutamine-hydrolysing)
MCGIAGFVRLSGQAAQAEVKSMCDAIVHRGPDDAGYYTDRGCGIGMRRLSIIDLAGGHQPISNEDGSLWIVFNGEIYNYQELRNGLLQRGHRFATNSDTETILHLYEEEGPACFKKLRGMFGCALWDVRKQELCLARDRFGKKPLYYAALPQGLYFGSELKCLRAAGLSLDLDQDALRLYFQFGYIPDPASPYRQVRKLPGGHTLVYRANGALAIEPYWRLPEPAPVAGNRAEACQRVRATVDEAVRLRMIADVPLGAFLSGGIDSSIVVSSMARQSSRPVKTFSIGFANSPAFNELPYAKMLAERYGTEHHEILVEPDSTSLVQRLSRHFDEPFADSSAIPTFLVSEFAVRHVKVALSGDGGDELFAGYPRFATTSDQGYPAWVRAGLAGLARALPYQAPGKNYLWMMSRPTAFERYLERNFAPYFLRRELLSADWMLPDNGDYLSQRFAAHLLPESWPIAERALYFETGVHLTGDMLVKVDRMSMANSLEVRSPLLDHELAALAATLPLEWKMGRDPATGAFQGKQILIDAFSDSLPKALLNRPKQGFSLPLADWFRGPLRDMAHSHVLGPRFLQRGIVSPDFARKLVTEHEVGRRDNSAWIWSLLMLDLWLQDSQN